MPHLRIETNVKSSSIDLEAALKELSAAMAETTGIITFQEQRQTFLDYW